MTALLALLVLGSVAVNTDPKFAVGGAEETVTVTVRVEAADAAQAKLTLTTNVGTLSGVERLDASTFRARLKPPAQRFPQVAILHAVAEWSDRAESTFIPVPIHGRDTLRLYTKPNAKVVVEIAGEKFGPIQADAKGAVQVPIVAPPGIATGTAVSEDRLGNKTKKAVPLDPPPFPLVRLADGQPSRRSSWADSAGHIVEGMVIRPDGAPGDARGVSVQPTVGAISELTAREGGRFVLSFRAPKKVDDGRAKLVAKARQGLPGELTLPVVAGPPTRLELLAESASVNADSVEPVRLSARAFDAEGNPVQGISPQLSATLGQLRPDSQDSAQVQLPSRFQGASEVTATAQLGALVASTVIALRPGAPSSGTLTLSKSTVEAGGGTARGALSVFDKNGNPVPGAAVVVQTSEGLRGEARDEGAGRYTVLFSPEAEVPATDTELTAAFENGFRLAAPLTILPAPRGLSISAGPWVRAQTSFVTGAMGIGGELSFAPTRRFELLLDVGNSWFGTLSEDHEGASDPSVRKQADISRLSAMAGLRYSVPLSARWALSGSLLGGVNRTSTQVTVSGVAGVVPVSQATIEPALRGGVGALARLGPGRLLVEARVGYAPSNGPVSGNLEPVSVALAYLWEVR